MTSLPSRYEDLDEPFKGRLEPNQSLLEMIRNGIKSMAISGGIRFLPVFGESGSGKSCASREIDKHLPDTHVFVLERHQIEDQQALIDRVMLEQKKAGENRVLIAVIDQFEETVVAKESLPTQFIEQLSILDRSTFRKLPIFFIWLTTKREFQQMLEKATSRNTRILLSTGFTINGPAKSDWPRIIGETFSFHNKDKSLADYGIVDSDIKEISNEKETIGDVLQQVGERIGNLIPSIQNLSEYRVILVWPVADGTRMQRVLQFTRPREGYLLNWDAWLRELSPEDKEALPIKEYNRARLYFDMRVIPLRVADIHRLCLDLENDNFNLAQTYLRRFSQTHLYHIVSGAWETYKFSPIRERESDRSTAGLDWYSKVTTEPTALGKRLAKVFTELQMPAIHEETLTSRYSKVRADIFVKSSGMRLKHDILELKVFSSEYTMPSTIKDQIRITLRRHAQFAGFLDKQ